MIRWMQSPFVVCLVLGSQMAAKSVGQGKELRIKVRLSLFSSDRVVLKQFGLCLSALLLGPIKTTGFISTLYLLYLLQELPIKILKLWFRYLKKSEY